MPGNLEFLIKRQGQGRPGVLTLGYLKSHAALLWEQAPSGMYYLGIQDVVVIDLPGRAQRWLGIQVISRLRRCFY
jgi:hypothetical protein